MVTALVGYLLVQMEAKPFIAFIALVLGFFQDVAICYFLFSSIS